MKNTLRTLWDDDRGFIVSAELVILVTVLVVGLVAGMVCLRDSLVAEYMDIGCAIGSLNQSYGFSGAQGCCKSGCAPSFVSGSFFNDYQDGGMAVGHAAFVDSQSSIFGYNGSSISSGAVAADAVVIDGGYSIAADGGANGGAVFNGARGGVVITAGQAGAAVFLSQGAAICSSGGAVHFTLSAVNVANAGLSVSAGTYIAPAGAFLESGVGYGIAGAGTVGTGAVIRLPGGLVSIADGSIIVAAGNYRVSGLAFALLGISSENAASLGITGSLFANPGAVITLDAGATGSDADGVVLGAETYLVPGGAYVISGGTAGLQNSGSQNSGSLGAGAVIGLPGGALSVGSSRAATVVPSGSYTLSGSATPGIGHGTNSGVIGAGSSVNRFVSPGGIISVRGGLVNGIDSNITTASGRFVLPGGAWIISGGNSGSKSVNSGGILYLPGGAASIDGDHANSAMIPLGTYTVPQGATSTYEGVSASPGIPVGSSSQGVYHESSAQMVDYGVSSGTVYAAPLPNGTIVPGSGTVQSQGVITYGGGSATPIEMQAPPCVNGNCNQTSIHIVR